MSAAIGFPPANLMARLEEDPYPVYARFRGLSGPLMWAQEHWFVLGHHEAMAVLRDRRLTGGSGQHPAAISRRELVRGTFTPAFAERLRPRAQELTDMLLDKGHAAGAMDLVADLTVPLALTVAGELLGLRPAQADVVNEWVTAITDTLAPPRGHRMRPGGQGTIEPTDAVRDCLDTAIEERQGELIGLLANAEGPDGRRLEAAELLDVCVELLVSAHLSTVDLIGNGVHALLNTPLQAERLRDDPGLIATGVEELLRYDPPVQRITRVAAEDVTIGEQAIKEGQVVVVLVGAANRDPDVFDAPDSLDLSRDPNHHLTFGRGMRFCLGAPLATVQAQVAIGSLFARFPAARLDGAPRRRAVRGVRGFSVLPVAL